MVSCDCEPAANTGPFCRTRADRAGRSTDISLELDPVLPVAVIAAGRSGESLPFDVVAIFILRELDEIQNRFSPAENPIIAEAVAIPITNPLPCTVTVQLPLAGTLLRPACVTDAPSYEAARVSVPDAAIASDTTNRLTEENPAPALMAFRDTLVSAVQKKASAAVEPIACFWVTDSEVPARSDP